MIKEIKMPNAGQTNDTATICQWHVSIGDAVRRGDILVDVETDKTVLPVESFINGIIIDLFVQEGDVIEGGDVIALIGSENDLSVYKKGEHSSVGESFRTGSEDNDNDFVPVMKGSESKNISMAVSALSLSKESKSIRAMPNAKRLAREYGIDLSRITIANGNFIKRKDVILYKETHTADDYEVLLFNKMRKIIAARMVESVSKIPMFSVTIDVDMTNTISMRQMYKEVKDVRISYNDILLKAIAKVATSFRLLNARYENDEVRIYKNTNIGIAVSLEGGLIVPVIKKVDQMSLEQIAENISIYISKARIGKLLPGDMNCGSVTVSNLGMYNVEHFNAIINPSESCIFAVGTIINNPVWNGDAFIPKPVLKITGTFDHRIIDGAYAAQLMNQMKRVIENPVGLFF